MRSDAGNELWRSLSDEVSSGREVLPGLVEKEITNASITLLLAHLINDAKYNVAKQNQFYETSKSFLLNEYGELERWLDLVHVENMETALWKLREFVFHGHVKKLGYLRRMV